MSKRFSQYIPVVVIGSLVFAVIITGFAKPYFSSSFKSHPSPLISEDSSYKDTINLKYPIQDNTGDPVLRSKRQSMDLKTPPVYTSNIALDSSLNSYNISNSVGGEFIGDMQNISLSDYLKEVSESGENDYFKERTKKQNFVKDYQGMIPKLTIKTPKVIDKIMGGGIEIKPQGSAELIFSYDHNRVSNPSWSIRQQKTGQFKFDQKIKLNVRGNIGNKIALNIGYDTESSFDFDNQIKLRFDGEEDDIVKQLEVGNLSLPVQGTLITGSQSLFGVKAKLQFGKLTSTSVLSQQRSEKKEIDIENGAQKTTFNIDALNYDAYRNYFLNLYFRNSIYEQALSRLPVVASPILITRIEVWMVNKIANYSNTRNVVGFMDIGEPQPWNSNPKNPQKGNFVTANSSSLYPSNNANTLYAKLIADKNYRLNNKVITELGLQANNTGNFYNGQDYVQVDNARMLAPSEYTINSQLGYISLNQSLDPSYALAVAYQYTINGAVYQVGEFAEDVPPDPNNPNVLFLKLLKGTSTQTNLPTWDLMMKNIYTLGASQIQPNDFKLDIIYEDNKSGAYLNYLPENTEPNIAGKILLQVLGLDRLNSEQQLQPDGLFDFLDGRTILSGSGKVIFPVLEPFGSYLKSKFQNQTIANKYAFQAIYDSTQVEAQQLTQFDKFYLKGYYTGTSGSVISLNAINVPEGSVKVTAGGVQLAENVDYTVDYSLGRVTIINQSVLNSGQPIKITCESQSLVSLQQKTFIAERLDYRFNQDFNIGSTMEYLDEKPLTRKVNIGDEPIDNVIIGVDGSYRTDSRFLTKLVDKIPLISTKEKSEISLSGEGARLFPGHPKIIGRNGTSYIDDFEGAEVPYDLRTAGNWILASVPQGQPDIFQNGNLVNTLKYGYQRAKLAWYTIDNMFYTQNQYTPPNINSTMLSDPSMMEINETDIFPNEQLPQGIPATCLSLDLAYFPQIRGPYNYDWASLNNDGTLKNPQQNWAGIMRALQTNDFEQANIEYLEFWVMDPYLTTDNSNTGKLYIHLGDVSEDILKDGMMQFENGLNATGNLKTIWGYVPSGSPINYAFDNDPSMRQYQDVGLDGLSDKQEQVFFDSSFIIHLPPTLSAGARDTIMKDPSADDYHFFRGGDLDAANANIIQRYMNYRNTEGNSPINSGVETTSATLSPDVEDIDGDFTLSQVESYYQYAIDIKPNMQVGQNFVVDKMISNKKLPNGKSINVTFYQFKVPVTAYQKRVGQINDFKSIRFMRLALAGFQKPVVMRFCRLQLVRGEWRKYLYSLKAGGEVVPSDPIDTSTFDISTVSIEANSSRQPFPYVLPPGIQREVDYTTTQLLQMNEQSMQFVVSGLTDGDARAAYKTTSFDVRSYRRLQMYVHAEGKDLKQSGNMTLFIRMGCDFTNNYYEYEEPLVATPNGTSDPNLIWRPENDINLAFDEFYRVKQERQNLHKSSAEPFQDFDLEHKGRITVMGNPDLSNVQVVMIGIRNPNRRDNPYDPNDDGLPKTGTVWVDELRVSDFIEKGGYAALGKFSAKLADLGKVTLSGNIKTIGFGGIDQKLEDRSKDNETGFNFETYLDLGKFFKQKANVKIPMYYNYSYEDSKPEYNPLSPDILLQTTLDLAPSKAARDSILRASETKVIRKGINFTNVQKLRASNKKAHFYNIENFLVSYIYSNTFQRDPNTAYNNKSTYKFVINYMYNFRDKSISPFKKLIKSKRLQFIKNFNFSFIPQSMAFNCSVDRYYGQILYRNTSDFTTLLTPLYEKNFNMTRTYDVKYNPFKSLSFSYNAIVVGYFPEPPGPVTSSSKDSIFRNLYKGGQTQNFDQKINLTYDLPFKQFKTLDWLSAKTSYSAGYNWTAAPPADDSLGNQIQNSRTIQINGQINFSSLYSKSPYLRNISQGKSNLKDYKAKKLKELKEKEKKKGNKDWDKLTENDVEINEGLFKFTEELVRLLLTVKSINVTYTINDGMLLPGFMPQPKNLGNNWDLDAPGLPFILGSQQDIFPKVKAGNWLTPDTNLNTLFTRTHSQNLVIQAMLEPIKGLKISIDAERKYNESYSALYKRDEFGQYPGPESQVTSGSFSISFFSLPTSLKGKYSDKISSVFQKFENNRYVIAQRLSVNRYGRLIIDDSTHFPKGYSKTNQEVLIPAFLAAYSNKNPSSYSLNTFPQIPAPNWRISYGGMVNSTFLKNFIKSYTISNAFHSTYNVSSFATNLSYDSLQVIGVGQDVQPKYYIQQISIMEQLSPLIGIDINWVDNWTTKIDYTTSRNLNFTFANYQLNEMMERDFTIGVGYRATKFKIPFTWQGKKLILDNDLTFRFDFSIRSNRSVINQLDNEDTESQSVGGNRTLVISPIIEYTLSKNLILKIFFTRTVTKPTISTSYPTAFTSTGFSLRYTLGQ